MEKSKWRLTWLCEFFLCYGQCSVWTAKNTLNTSLLDYCMNAYNHSSNTIAEFYCVERKTSTSNLSMVLARKYLGLCPATSFTWTRKTGVFFFKYRKILYKFIDVLCVMQLCVYFKLNMCEKYYFYCFYSLILIWIWMQKNVHFSSLVTSCIAFSQKC